MALIRGLFVRKDATRGTTPVEARKALAGIFASAGSFGARSGVLSAVTVVGTAAWSYSIGACSFITSRSSSDGVVLAANDGAATVATTAAPSTGGRVDLIWVRHGDVDAGEATSNVVFGVTAGVVSGTPQPPALPAGALELAQATVMAGATSTSHANVTIAVTAQRTSLRGAAIDVPNEAARQALGNPPAGSSFVVAQIDTGELWLNTGSAWTRPGPREVQGQWRGTGQSVTTYLVTHGLGVIPSVILTQWTGPITSAEYTTRVTARTATTFTIGIYYNGLQNNGSIPNDRGFDWVVRA